MSESWSIKNLCLPVSFNQFRSYADQFRQAAEHSFGTDVQLAIRAMSAPEVYTTFYDEDLFAKHREINDANTFLKTDDLDRITPEIWKQAAYVAMRVLPVNPDEKLKTAYGLAEFKGTKPRQASFYAQPDGTSIRDAMLSGTFGKITKTGQYDSNGQRDGTIPLGVLASLPKSVRGLAARSFK